MQGMISQINRRNTPFLSKEDMFSGNPLAYRRFIKHFDAYTAKGVANMAERLDLLISSCTGEARANISDCIMALNPELGYFKACRILESLYGQRPSLKANDRSGLSTLSRARSASYHRVPVKSLRGS